MYYFLVSRLFSVDEIEEFVFDCGCGGCCTDSNPGYMIDDEQQKCCKGSSWSSLDFSGSVRFVNSILELFQDLQ